MSLASGRAARHLAPSAKNQALAKLAQLKQGGLKRTDQFEVRRRPCLPRSSRRANGLDLCSRALVLWLVRRATGGGGG